MRVLTSIILAAWIAGCANTPAREPVEPEVLYRGSHCGGEQSAVSWIMKREQYREALSRAGAPAPEALPEVDFDRAGVVFIEMGQRPTAGYGIDLLRAAGAEDILTLDVDWREPPEGAFTAQVITQPCLLLKVSTQSYGKVRVVDRQGQLRLQTP